MIPALLVFAAAVNVAVMVLNAREAKRLEARAHTLNVRRRALVRRRHQLRSQRFATDCEHLTNLAVARLLTERARFLGINPLGGDDSRKAVA